VLRLCRLKETFDESDDHKYKAIFASELLAFCEQAVFDLVKIQSSLPSFSNPQILVDFLSRKSTFEKFRFFDQHRRKSKLSHTTFFLVCKT
jgi:hypothetical protein